MIKHEFFVSIIHNDEFKFELFVDVDLGDAPLGGSGMLRTDWEKVAINKALLTTNWTPQYGLIVLVQDVDCQGMVRRYEYAWNHHQTDLDWMFRNLLFSSEYLKMVS